MKEQRLPKGLLLFMEKWGGKQYVVCPAGGRYARWMGVGGNGKK